MFTELKHRETEHHLKVLPEFFQALWCGDKTFEIRYNDRDFKERDMVVLEEWVPIIDGGVNGDYTGRKIYAWIRYLTTFKQLADHVVFSIEEARREEE